MHKPRQNLMPFLAVAMLFENRKNTAIFAKNIP